MHKKSGHFKGSTWSLSKGGLSSVQSPSASPSPSSEPSLTQTTSSPACCLLERRCFGAGFLPSLALLHWTLNSWMKKCKVGIDQNLYLAVFTWPGSSFGVPYKDTSSFSFEKWTWDEKNINFAHLGKKRGLCCLGFLHRRPLLASW